MIAWRSKSKRFPAWCLLAGMFLLSMLAACGKNSPNGSDGEPQWVAINNGLVSPYVNFLAVHPSNSSILFAGTWDGLFRSTNSGQSWARLDSGWAYTEITCLAFASGDDDIIYVGTNGDGIYKSTDGGTHWLKKNSGLGDLKIYSIITHPEHQDTVFAGIDTGIYRSVTAADSSWSEVYWLPRAFLAIDATNPDIIYAGGRWNGFCKSDDGGNPDSWRSSAEGLPGGGPEVVIKWILIHPQDAKKLYTSSSNFGIYKSSNAAGNWTEANVSLPTEVTRAIVADVSGSVSFYCATSRGVFVSTDDAASWAAMNTGLTSTDVRILALDSRSDILYAGTWGGGVFKFAFP